MGKPSDLFRSDRYRSQARLHSDQRITKPITGDSTGGPILPLYQAPDTLPKAGGLDDQDAGRGPPSGPTASGQRHGGDGNGGGGDAAENGGARASGSPPEGSTAEKSGGGVPQSAAPPASGPDTQVPREGDSAVKSTPGQGAKKPPITKRMLAGSKRFLRHTKKALFRSWINLLLVFVPIGIIAEALNLNPSLVFAMNAIAIVPLAGLLSFATECVAARMGDTLGALLNVSFGNAVELIIFIIALVKNEIAIVQASLLGSILANLLLILGMAFLFGGLRYREQIYNSTVTQMSACLLSLSVMSLLLPTAFHASFSATSAAAADLAVLKVSRGTSVILLVIYVLYLLFQLKSHAYMYESTPQAIIDEESHPGLLADMMNSSSSSSDASSTDSTDTDTSGSVITTGQKLRKKMFRRRRRRQSSASISSTTASSVIPSVVSSPPLERAGSYLDTQSAAAQSARGESALGVIASGDEADADVDQPRIRDFVNISEKVRNDDDAKTIERKKLKRKYLKRHRGKRHHHDEEKDALEREETETPKTGKTAATRKSQPRVGFADDPDRVDKQPEPQPTAPEQPPGRLTFNMRGLSSKVVYPALPSYLSNTVFTTPAPRPETAKQSVQPALSRARSEAYGLRRSNSLPDRLNRQLSAPGRGPSTTTTTTNPRTDPIPPFQHQTSNLSTTSNPAAAKDSSSDPSEEEALMSRTAALVLLLLTTSLVAVCAEFMVSAIPLLIADSPVVSEAFIGLIILPIVGNAAEHVTAVTVAAKNKMDLAIGVAVGSSIQIALFVTPIIVLLGWGLGRDMSLYFNLFETVSLFVTAFVVNFLVLDGRSNYLEGSLLIATYIIIALGAFFYPSSDNQSLVGGAGSSRMI
ncbi:hypothetical protein LTR91_009078 [Friedmanniomyces endolithicus]|uniref:Sodium/calcium exchanger membrane region domain-containing protein n=1 Tax=Friedmanniomyces endolithicus TaxID=329885 RepID=A0AAN6KLD1_9PEZI|nr:hypothetical protein LTR73_007426 [Friedmanniomyces endolithicus]KAK0918199.1 hypothetical protein LTR57_012033 [Friedmanniomyces endolithicus]KAK0989812.1 hypothetical protein LTR91_009078 [Friedmanniomyces endolithicus]KAK1001251.1 hypothetical protein LTS01_004725 [Friedmanniomyces endolithicus]KAK1038698.1 hypothetical protein LTS16_011851 [Friedmanniomyces endolithicus]